MTDDIIEITYKQTLRHTGEAGKTWSERVRIAVSFLSGALTSGWLRANFSDARAGGPTDLMVLLGIALHARPLTGDELARLIRLGVATEADEGRMFTWVSDKTLADELGLGRETIAASAHRLQDRNLLSIWELDEQLRDQSHQVRRGQSVYVQRGFGVSRFYVLSGDLEQFLSKTVTPIRAASSSTDATRAAPSDTGDLTRAASSRTGAKGASEPVRYHAAPHAASSDTNDLIGGEGGGDAAPLSVNFSDDDVLGYFLARKGKPHAFSAKELKALADLRTAGYTLDEIKAGIDKAFARPGGCRHFTLCAVIIRDTSPAHLSGPTRSQPESARPPEDARPLPEVPTRKPDNGQDKPDDLTIPPELARPVGIFRGTGEPLTLAKLSRLKLMAEKYHPAASAHGTS